jgi:nucleoid DNA-binding protein
MKRCLTKAEIADRVFVELDIDKQRAANLVDQVLEITKQALAEEGKLLISGFGTFVVNFKEARRGRNPKTGGPLTLRERKVVKFKPSSILRRAVNGGIDCDDSEDEE